MEPNVTRRGSERENCSRVLRVIAAQDDELPAVMGESLVRLSHDALPTAGATSQGIIMRDGGICDPIRHMGC